MPIRKRVLEQIAQARESRSTRLDLSGRHLEEVPAELVQLDDLEELNLSHNRITELPAALNAMPRLKIVDVRSTSVGALPDGLTYRLDFPLYARHRGRLNDDQVFGINLHRYNLEDFVCVVDEGRLTQLRELVLDVSEANDELLVAITRLATLNSLALTFAEVSSLPEDFGRLVELRRLDLAGNRLEALPDSFAELTRISSLDLANNQFEKLPESLRALGALRTLNLQDNALTRVPDWLSDCASVAELDLSENSIDVFPAWSGRWAGLRKLDLGQNHLTSLPDAMAGLAGLEELSLYSNRLVDVPLSVCRLPSLQTLSLKSNQITHLPDEIGQLATLTVLEVDNNKLDTLPQGVSRLQALQSLWLNKNAFTSVPPLVTALPSLRHLRMNGNALTEFAIDLSGLELRSINASANRLTTFTANVDVEHLETLDVSANALDTWPPMIADLPALRTLNLANNRIAVVPDEVSTLKALVSLDVRSNHLTSLPLSMATLRSLLWLWLDDNRIEQVPEVLALLPKLSTLSLSNNRVRELPVWMADLSLSNLQLDDVPQLNIPEDLVYAPFKELSTYLRDLPAGHVRNHEIRLVVCGQRIQQNRWVDQIAKALGADKQRSSRARRTARLAFTPEGQRVTNWITVMDVTGEQFLPPDQRFVGANTLYLLSAVVPDAEDEEPDHDTLLTQESELYRQLATAARSVTALSGSQAIAFLYGNKRNHATLAAKLSEHQSLAEVAMGTNVAETIGSALVPFLAGERDEFPMARRTVPLAWRAAAERLREVDAAYIDWTAFEQTCRSSGVDATDHADLARFLGESGAVLYQANLARLNDKLILDARRFLECIPGFGRFPFESEDGIVHRTAIESMLDAESEARYASSDEMLALLEGFEWCCPTVDPDRYCVPQYLPSMCPEPRTLALLEALVGHPHIICRFRDYDPNVLTRLLASLGGSSQHQFFWRSGGFIEARDDCAIVIGDAEHHEITLRMLRSPEHRLIGVLFRALEFIAGSQSHAMYMPCSCEGCQLNNDPVLFSFDQLESARQLSTTMVCPRTRQTIAIDALLFRISQGPEPTPDAGDSTASQPEIAHAPCAFVSYFHEDSGAARSLKSHLENAGVDVIVYEDDPRPGQLIDFVIDDYLENSDVTILIVSERSLGSSWVLVEIMRTLLARRDRKFIACCLDERYKDDGFVIEVLDRVEPELDKVIHTIKQHHERQRDSRSLDERKSRLIALRDNLDQMVEYLRESVTVDISGTCLEQNVPTIVDWITGQS